MPMIRHKAKTATSVMSSAPSLDALLNMSDADFLATAAEHRKALKDRIDRRTTAAMLGITVRTLDRWHDRQYGPRRLPTHPIRYSKAEVEAWVAEHGGGSHRPHRTREANVHGPHPICN